MGIFQMESFDDGLHQHKWPIASVWTGTSLVAGVNGNGLSIPATGTTTSALRGIKADLAALATSRVQVSLKFRHTSTGARPRNILVIHDDLGNQRYFLDLDAGTPGTWITRVAGLTAITQQATVVDSWQTLELWVDISNSGGGAKVLLQSSVGTRLWESAPINFAGSGKVGQVWVGYAQQSGTAASSTAIIDDVVIQAGDSEKWLVDWAVHAALPNTQGFHDDWSLLAGASKPAALAAPSMVASIGSSTDGARDSYGMTPALPASPQIIHGVQVNLLGVTPVPGWSVVPFCRVGGSNTELPAIPLSSTPSTKRVVADEDPATNALWTRSKVNGEWGLRAVSP